MTSKPENLRNYQAELFEIAKCQNSILFLPTGSGKTCIAIWLIKHLSADLKKPYSEGGKRTIFLVNTTELAYQQSTYVRDAGNFKVKVVCAKEGVDNWGQEQWDNLEQFEVIVLTAQCYLNGLTHGYMLLENANLLIFDECHHAVKTHPMREIMKKFEILPREINGPHVLGLSATILNSNVENEQFKKQLADLESTFRASIITSTFAQEIQKFATKPNEIVKDFKKPKIPKQIEEFISTIKDQSKLLAEHFKLKDDEIVEHLMEQRPGLDDVLINVPGTNRLKLVINAIKDITVHCREFGMFIGFICCNLYIIQMYRFMFELEKTGYVDLVLYFINEAQIIRKILYDEIIKINGKISLDSMTNTSTEKLRYLFDVLRTLEQTEKCIIFVERKMTAKSLYFIIKWFIRLENVSNIRIDFITGTDCNPLRNTREMYHEKKMRDKVLKSFKGDQLNVLIATNIVEEGIDVPNCSLVIMFDEVKTYRSYVQSKGRARMSKSRYIILNDIPRDKFLDRLNHFWKIEEFLMQFVRDKEINWDDDNSPDLSPESEFYTTTMNASIKEENAISLIYRYCSTLPTDIFTSLIPFWWSSDEGENKVCKLQLPINSPIREMLVSPPRSTLKKAKQAVAFEAVKLLHALGALDDRLLPVSGSAKLEDIKEWVPNWDESATENSEQTGSPEFSPYKLKLPTCLQDSRPVANEECYIHLINIKPEYDVPDVNRKKFCHELMAYNCNFGILTRNPLPDLCRFPVYSDLGRCRVSIHNNAAAVFLNEKEISSVANFHKFLFVNVIRKVKKFLLFDSKSASGYFIVPLTQNKTKTTVDIAWKVVRQKIERIIVRPSEQERKNEIFSEENYLSKVVTPWYRHVEDPTFYIVTNFFSGLYLHTKMEENKTYAEHFEKNYNLQALQLGQPMMEVRAITKNFDSIKPRSIPSSARQKKKRNEDKPTYLAPEFVTKQSLNSVYWYKSILLPSILHRFQQLLLAEELRQELVEKTGVGRLDIVIDKKEEQEYFLRALNVPITVQHISKLRKFHVEERKKYTKNKNERDLVRDIYHCEDFFNLTVSDVRKFVEYVEQPLYSSGRARAGASDSENFHSEDHQRIKTEYVIDFISPPPLITLADTIEGVQGPNQYEILQATTLRGANDTIDLERHETLGDSALKYLVSFAIFIREGKMNEGLLTSLKSRIICNKYLYDCAKKLNIPEYIQTTAFTVDKGWIPPLFCIPPHLDHIIRSVGKLSSLLRVTIPHHEQFSGNLSFESVEQIADAVKKFVQTVEEIDKNEEAISSFFLGLRKLSNKSIADVVEALIGVYLQTCGIQGAFKIMKYFGILAKEDYASLMSHRFSPVVPPECVGKVLNLIPDYKKIERLLHYEFRDKGLLLQAVTHPSCLTNNVTDCYQKLEFMGDAILDFLITSYIYQYCGKLSPGQITDLRSALVNNNTFGALAVRLGLQKYLLDHNKSLEDAISAFVSYQKSQNFEIHGNAMMKLINESDTNIAEEVEVPKVLGDIFESLAGAIFIDSRYDLAVVWKIYFNIMADEIAKFCSKIPINPVRALYELHVKGVKFSENEKPVATSKTKGIEKLVVRLSVHTKKDSYIFMGRGCNTASARRAAAKLALKRLGYSDFVI